MLSIFLSHEHTVYVNMSEFWHKAKSVNQIVKNEMNYLEICRVVQNYDELHGYRKYSAHSG